jgi:hypothetical protein
MSGTSFKCPECDHWSISRRYAEIHLWTSHHIGGATVRGSGEDTWVEVTAPYHQVVNACRKLPWYRGDTSVGQFRAAFNAGMGCDIPNGPVDEVMAAMLKVLTR